MRETWRDIERTKYQVSNCGNVKHNGFHVRTISKHGTRGKRWVPPHTLWQLTNNFGYKTVNLHGKVCTVHRLVALAFIPNPQRKKTVNHINGIKTDNRVENLEWATYSENIQHAVDTGLSKNVCGSSHGNAKINEKIARRVIRMLLKGKTIIEISREIGISDRLISNIKRRRNWKHVLPDIEFRYIGPGNSKLSETDIIFIKSHLVKGFNGNANELADKFSVNRKTILRAYNYAK